MNKSINIKEAQFKLECDVSDFVNDDTMINNDDCQNKFIFNDHKTINQFEIDDFDS